MKPQKQTNKENTFMNVKGSIKGATKAHLFLPTSEADMAKDRITKHRRKADFTVSPLDTGVANPALRWSQ